MPFSRLAIRKAFWGIRKRATGFVLLAILFLLVGLVQHAFVSRQIRETTKTELNEAANEIAGVIYKNGQWDMVSYRQAFIPTISSWYVFSNKGLLIDNEGPITNLLNLFHDVQYPTNLLFGTPQTVTSEVGGTYRLLAKKIQNGVVVVGFDTESPTNSACGECIDQELSDNLEIFGRTLGDAVQITPKQVNEQLNFAVISDSGKLKTGLGEVPLQVDPTEMIDAAQQGHALNFDGQSYILVSKNIFDSDNKIIGTIIVPGDITLQNQAVQAQLKFNLGLSALAFVVVVLISVYFIGRELIKKPHFETLPEALKTPESLKKEFKRSFQWDTGKNCKNLEVRIQTFKTIVAFLNSEGGVLFIGINDDLTVRGIKEDLEIFNGSIDKFLLMVREIIASKIGAEFAPLIDTRCESIQDKTVCVIEVQNSTEPAFLKDDSKSHFYTRESNRTNELDPKETNAFIRSRRWNK